MPPYHSGTGGSVLAGLRNENLCAPQALAVLEIQSEEPMPDAAQAEGWELEDDRTYGVTRLLFYRAS
jgi:16S rRNA G966 N2-methylase RsmD